MGTVRGVLSAARCRAGGCRALPCQPQRPFRPLISKLRYRAILTAGALAGREDGHPTYQPGRISSSSRSSGFSMRAASGELLPPLTVAESGSAGLRVGAACPGYSKSI